MNARQRVVSGVKRGVAAILYHSGVLGLCQRVMLRNRAVVLMYHRVLTPGERRVAGSSPGIIVERDTFARQVALLKRRFIMISLADFATHVTQRIPFRSSSCLITFDDGWRDNLTNALPALTANDVPAVLFLPVNFIGTRRLFWREAMTHLLIEAAQAVRRDPERRTPLRGVLAPARLESVLDIGATDPRPEVVELLQHTAAPSPDIADGMVNRLARELSLDLASFSSRDGFLDWSEVGTMTEHQVALGGHGADHLRLTQASLDDRGREIGSAHAELTSRVPGTVPTFSYPNGDWSPEIADTVRALGFQLAFTTRPGSVACDDDAFAINRVNIHEDATATMPLFLTRILGLF